MNYVKLAFMAAVVAVSGYNVYQSQFVMNGMSEFALANVEALADNENDGTGTLYGNAAGDRFCCCPGSTRSCAASNCSNC